MQSIELEGLKFCRMISLPIIYLIQITGLQTAFPPHRVPALYLQDQ